jgi:predicted ATP-binding protein involved in virulence
MARPTPPQAIKSLSMREYRGIRDCTVTFTPFLTVLVGRNGAGKTAILDCLHLLFDSLFMSLNGPAELMTAPRKERTALSRNAARTDVSIGAKQMLCEVSFDVRWTNRRTPRTYRWPLNVAVNGRDGLARELIRPENRTLITDFFQASEEPWAEIPLTIHYTVDRANVDSSAPAIEEADRVFASNPYEDTLAMGGATFRWFARWFREREDAENAAIARNSRPGWRRPTDRQLDAVRIAVQKFMPGFEDLHVQRKPEPRIAIHKSGVDLLLNQLSQGERSLIALVADLARRLAMIGERKKKTALASLALPAWVLIDEIELHLHPAWQRDVLTRLRSTFPNAQFIVTTHSPLVLADVPASSVRLLTRNGGSLLVAEPASPTAGRDTNAILEEVMGTSERPDKQRAELTRIADLIDRNKLAAARTAVDRLANTLTERDSEIVRLRSMLQFLERP